MNWRINVAIFLALIAGLVLIGAASGHSSTKAPTEVLVNLKEYSVEMSKIDLPVDQPIKFIFINSGVIPHAIALEKAGGDTNPLIINGSPAEVVNIDPGASVTQIWTLNAAGQYQLACHIAGHFEGGMVEDFTARPTGLTAILEQPLLWLAAAVVLFLAVLWASWVALSKPHQPVFNRE